MMFMVPIQAALSPISTSRDRGNVKESACNQQVFFSSISVFVYQLYLASGDGCLKFDFASGGDSLIERI
jgi:hypothetical protein